jgi:hypothetical protein
MKTRLLLTLLAATWAGAVQAQPKPEGFLCCNMRSDGRWISDNNDLESGKFTVALVRTDPDTRMRVVLD